MMTAPLPDIAAPAAPPRRLPFSFAKRQGLLFLCLEEQYWLACRPQVELAAIAEAQRFAGRRLPLKALGEDAFNQALAASYQHDSSAAMQLAEDLGGSLDLAALADQVPETEDLMEQEDDAPIIRLINAILGEAIRENASDIHLETFEKRLVVRFRVDGVLREVLEPKRELAALLVSRIKVMARLDIAEKRIPQDGRISLRVGGREVDIRVSTLPSANGERVVLRLLDKQAGRLNLQHLGMSERDRKLMDETVRKPHGILLVTGPTGSGKTVSLYTGLNILNTTDINISTAEDPVEINLEGINQVNVNPRQGMDFSQALRAFLRQDPDVIMVGEIRDLETAEIAIKAAQTGHMVMSTLHTNSAAETLTRLLNMGVPAFNLATSVNLIIAQRLARKLCSHCKKEHDVPKETLLHEGFPEELIGTFKLYSPVGCENCKGGYKGRVGIYEVVKNTPALQRIIMEEGNSIEIAEQARKEGFNDLRTSGLLKAMQGITSLEEVNRVTKD